MGVKLAGAVLPKIAPIDDVILSYRAAAKRWGVHPKTAERRIKELNLRLVRFNAREVGVKLSEILRAEEAASV
jgi:hypothetical protein